MIERTVRMWSPWAVTTWLLFFMALGMVLSLGARGALQPILLIGYAGIIAGFVFGACRHDLRALERRIAELEAHHERGDEKLS